MYTLGKALIVAVVAFLFTLKYPDYVAGLLAMELYVLRWVSWGEQLRLLKSDEGDANRAYLLIVAIVSVGSGITWRRDFYPEIATVVNWSFLPILLYIFLLLRPSIRAEPKRGK